MACTRTGLDDKTPLGNAADAEQNAHDFFIDAEVGD